MDGINSTDLERSLGHRGLEVPTRYYQMWETPSVLSIVMDPAQSTEAAASRETFALVHSFFDIPTP
jgi:hypothetical protein